jgi:hypothetical protein
MNGVGNMFRNETAVNKSAGWVCSACLRAKSYNGAEKPLKAPQGRGRDPARSAAKLYDRLEDDQIRLLVLVPGVLGQPLEAELRIAKACPDGFTFPGTLERIQYTALSYHWGPAIFEQTIKCNGIPHPITPNLYLALQRIRASSSSAAYWWIDALCINQSDPLERSHQVSKMLEIFQNAEAVSAWLGEADLNIWTALSCGPKRLRSKLEFWPIPEMFNEVTDDSLCKKHFQSCIDGVCSLLSNTWFDRLWVKQEVWAAQRLRFRMGPKESSWDDLERLAHALDAFLSHSQEHRTKMTLAEYENPFNRLRRAARNDDVSTGPGHPTLEAYRSRPSTPRPTLDFVDVLYYTTGSQCSDFRDCVYGVLGMSRLPSQRNPDALESNGPLFIVDYTKTSAQVYMDVVRFLIRQNRDLSIITKLWKNNNGTTGHYFGGAVDLEVLPTWCPNLSLPLQARGSQGTTWRHQIRGPVGTRCTMLTAWGERPYLDIAVVEVGRIGATSLPSHSSETDSRRSNRIVLDPSFYSEAWSIMSSSNLHQEAEYISEAFEGWEWTLATCTDWHELPIESSMAGDMVVAVEGSGDLFIFGSTDDPAKKTFKGLAQLEVFSRDGFNVDISRAVDNIFDSMVSARRERGRLLMYILT